MRENSATISLREALASLPEVVDEAHKARLREDVIAFVDASKEKQWPIERILIAVKDLTAEAGLRSSTNILRTQSTLELRDMLLLDIVRWSVERFFGYSRRPPMGGGASKSQVKPS